MEKVEITFCDDVTPVSDVVFVKQRYFYLKCQMRVVCACLVRLCVCACLCVLLWLMETVPGHSSPAAVDNHPVTSDYCSVVAT